MDISTLHTTHDTVTLELLGELIESANSRVERDIVRLTIDLLGPRPGVALGSLRLLLDVHLPWLERRTVHRARARGMSWAGIGRLLGLSRQAVHERFARPPSMSDALPPPPLQRPDPDAAARRDTAAQREREAVADRSEREGGIVPW